MSVSEDGRVPLCSVKNLSVVFHLSTGDSMKAIDDVTLRIMPGDAVGLVGESGSGKSLLSMSILGLLPNGAETSGTVTVDGTEVLSARPKQLRRLRGRTVGIILQDPSASLNPTRRISRQLRESALRSPFDPSEIDTSIANNLTSVGLRPELVLQRYPFELSGGMNQRVAIAMALLQSPKLLIADEPTTALDSSVQMDILHLLRELKDSRAMALLLISHDLAVVYNSVEYIAVMYLGKLVEYGSAKHVVENAKHPYTRSLLRAVPRLTATPDKLESIPGQLRVRLVGDTGCPLRSRCTFAMPSCSAFPPESSISDDHSVWCWLYPQRNDPSTTSSTPSPEPGSESAPALG